MGALRRSGRCLVEKRHEEIDLRVVLEMLLQFRRDTLGYVEDCADRVFALFAAEVDDDVRSLPVIVRLARNRMVDRVARCEGGSDDQRGQHQSEYDEARLETSPREVPDAHLEHVPVGERCVADAQHAHGEDAEEHVHDCLHREAEKLVHCYLRSSPMIWPSFMLTRRWQRLPTPGSCVTMTNVWACSRFRASMMDMISFAVFQSS